MAIGRTLGGHKLLKFDQETELNQENVLKLLFEVKQLIENDFIFSFIECKDIKINDPSEDYIVYFGPAENVLFEGKQGDNLRQAARLDKTEFSEQNYSFFYNDDNECINRFGIDKEY